MNDNQDNAEQKGVVRQMFSLSEASKERLKQVAKRYSITQGELLEVLIDQMDEEKLEPLFREKRATKLALRHGTKAALIKKMGSLTPQQLAAIEAIVKSQ